MGPFPVKKKKGNMTNRPLHTHKDPTEVIILELGPHDPTEVILLEFRPHGIVGLFMMPQMYMIILL